MTFRQIKKQPDMITGNVNAENVTQTLLNAFTLMEKYASKEEIQPFDAFSMGVLMAYLQLRQADFDAWVKERM